MCVSVVIIRRIDANCNTTPTHTIVFFLFRLTVSVQFTQKERTEMKNENLVIIELNPRYIKSGFRSQALNIKQNRPACERKIACLLEVISSHILKHGNDCFASTPTLLKGYNTTATRYGVKSIKERTLYDLLKELENKKLVSKDNQRNSATWQNKRHISLNLEQLKIMFSGVINWAYKAAKAYMERSKMQSRRHDVEEETKNNNFKHLTPEQNNRNCSIRTKDLSKERKDIYKGKPAKEFYNKNFGELANEVEKLQDQARKGVLKSGGAKRLISIHSQCGFELAKPFKRFLNFIIATDKPKKRRVSLIQQFENKVTTHFANEDAKEQGVSDRLNVIVDYLNCNSLNIPSYNEGDINKYIKTLENIGKAHYESGNAPTLSVQ